MKYFVGIDVSKKTLDVALIDQDDIIIFRKQVKNTRSGISGFVKQVVKEVRFPSEVLFCMESTGVYNRLLLAHLVKQSCKVWVANPTHIKRSLGLVRGKSDRIDALRIAEFTSIHHKKARLYQPVRRQVEKLQILNRTRDQLVKVRTQLKNTLTELRFYDKGLKDLKRQNVEGPIKELSKQIKAVDKQIQVIIKQDEELNRIYKIAHSVIGIGPVTAVEVIITTNEFKDITDPKKFACYAGVAPFPNSSGTSLKGKSRVSPMANKRMKKLLHMAALSSIRYHNDLRSYYLNKVAQGKHKMSVLNAVRNKIVNRLFACIKQNRLYQPNLDLS